MSILSLFTSLFHSAEADFAKVETGCSTAEKFVGVVLGQAEAVSGVLAVIDPAIGGPILAGLAALKALQATVKVAVTAGASNVAASAGTVAVVSQRVVQLTALATDMATQLAPFYKVMANDAKTASAAVASQANVVGTHAAAA